MDGGWPIHTAVYGWLGNKVLWPGQLMSQLVGQLDYAMHAHMDASYQVTGFAWPSR